MTLKPEVLNQRRDRQRLVVRGRTMRAEIQQIFIDCDHWNRAVRKPEEEPIDADPNGELRAALKSLDWLTEADRGCVCPLKGNPPAQADTCTASVHWFNETRVQLP